LMVSTARKRNADAVRGGQVDLRLGHAQCLPWASASFDKAAALHSFQSGTTRRPACTKSHAYCGPAGSYSWC
jgi:hypothetical protein